jgi:hypothetical protein
MTGSLFARAFEMWKADYDADPDGFMGDAEWKSQPPQTYGEAAARAFRTYIDQIAGGAA